jgi:hypothetical protein
VVKSLERQSDVVRMRMIRLEDRKPELFRPLGITGMWVDEADVELNKSAMARMMPKASPAEIDSLATELAERALRYWHEHPEPAVLPFHPPTPPVDPGRELTPFEEKLDHYRRGEHPPTEPAAPVTVIDGPAGR